MLILELSKDSIKAAELTECQTNARASTYAQAMAGFIRWLASRYEIAQQEFQAKIAAYRSIALHDSVHARTPEIVANLQAGFEMYLEFAVWSGALDIEEKSRLMGRCWSALREAAAAQAKHQTAAEPTARFLGLLRAALASGTAHLAARDGGKPDESPSSCGWRGNSGTWVPLGECIGWVDGENLYLEPTAAHAVAHKTSRATDEALTISEQTLKKRLREKTLLASVDEKRETNTIRRVLAGTSRDVLHLLRATLLPKDDQERD
jgi:hypothetical protein